MALIKVTPDILRQRSNEVNGYKDEFVNTMGKLENLVKNLGEDWQGEAQTAFVNEFENVKKTINSFEQLLTRYAGSMKIAADELETADKSLKAKMSGSTIG